MSEKQDGISVPKHSRSLDPIDGVPSSQLPLIAICSQVCEINSEEANGKTVANNVENVHGMDDPHYTEVHSYKHRSDTTSETPSNPIPSVAVVGTFECNRTQAQAQAQVVHGGEIYSLPYKRHSAHAYDTVSPAAGLIDCGSEGRKHTLPSYSVVEGHCAEPFDNKGLSKGDGEEQLPFYYMLEDKPASLTIRATHTKLSVSYEDVPLVAEVARTSTSSEVEFLNPIYRS